MTEGLNNEAWLQANTVGWPQLLSTGVHGRYYSVPAQQIIKLARFYATTRPSLIKIADGLQRNLTGGQNVRAICALPALVGQ